MRHRLSTLILLFACFLAMNLSLLGQDAAAVHGIRGYLDPRTRIFHSIPHPDAPDAADPPATTTFTGKFVVNFTITVSSAIASTRQIGCAAGASLLDTGATNAIVEEAVTAVTRGTGTTVTCSVTIPYSWKLASAGTDTVRLSYAIISPVDFATPAGLFPRRQASQLLASFKVPVSGTTTTKAVSARI